MCYYDVEMSQYASIRNNLYVPAHTIYGMSHEGFIFMFLSNMLTFYFDLTKTTMVKRSVTINQRSI